MPGTVIMPIFSTAMFPYKKKKPLKDVQSDDPVIYYIYVRHIRHIRSLVVGMLVLANLLQCLCGRVAMKLLQI